MILISGWEVPSNSTKIEPPQNLMIPLYSKLLFQTICGDVNSWARVIHESHKHWSPTYNDDSTVVIVNINVSTTLHMSLQSSSDSTDFMLNWLKDIPDDPVPVENKEEKWWLTTPTLSEPIYTSESAMYARYGDVGCMLSGRGWEL